MWIAVSLWVAHLVGVLVYAAFAWRAIGAGGAVAPWLIGVPLVYAGLFAFITLFDFALAWLARTPRAPAQRIGAAQTLRMVAREWLAMIAAPWLMMTWRWQIRDPHPAPARLPVVLVHGVLCNAGAWARTAEKLAALGIAPIYAISYGPPLHPIEEFSAQLDAYLDQVLAATGARRAVLVTHSMGGIVARDWLRRYDTRKVARIVTIGAPHHGSVFAWLMAGACLAEIRWHSAWIEALPAAPASPPMVALWSPHDSMVAPQVSCLLDGAQSVAFPGVGHNALIGDGAVLARVVLEIDRAREDAAPTSESPG
jgi:predicted alpha/beta hydrolase family esterase